MMIPIKRSHGGHTHGVSANMKIDWSCALSDRRHRLWFVLIETSVDSGRE